jgi:hypothetical protein
VPRRVCVCDGARTHIIITRWGRMKQVYKSSIKTQQIDAIRERKTTEQQVGDLMLSCRPPPPPPPLMMRNWPFDDGSVCISAAHLKGPHPTAAQKMQLLLNNFKFYWEIEKNPSNISSPNYKNYFKFVNFVFRYFLRNIAK